MPSHQEILSLIQSVGAPTVIAILIIVRIERRLDRLTDAIISFPGDVARRACANAPETCPFKERT